MVNLIKRLQCLKELDKVESEFETNANILVNLKVAEVMLKRCDDEDIKRNAACLGEYLAQISVEGAWYALDSVNESLMEYEKIVEKSRMFKKQDEISVVDESREFYLEETQKLVDFLMSPEESFQIKGKEGQEIKEYNFAEVIKNKTELYLENESNEAIITSSNLQPFIEAYANADVSFRFLMADKRSGVTTEMKMDEIAATYGMIEDIYFEVTPVENECTL